MATFQASRTYTKALDLFTDAYAEIAEKISQPPPDGFVWLFVSRRRGRKTWTLKGLHQYLGLDKSRVVDFSEEEYVIEPKGVPGFVHLFDEPALLLGKKGGAGKFLKDCRKIHDAGEQILLALTPHELSIISKQGLNGRPSAEFGTQVTFLKFSFSHAEKQARSPGAAALLPQLPPDWTQTPYLLELVFETHEKCPDMKGAELLRAVLERANWERYPFRVFRDSLNEIQREAVLKAAHHMRSVRTVDHDWLCETGYLQLASQCEAGYRLSDPVLAANLSPLRIHHLSDLHFGQHTAMSVDDKTGGSPLANMAGQKAVRDEYLGFVKKLKTQGTAPHLVVVSGDIGERGESNEYVEAKNFFAELRTLLADDLQLDADAPRILLVGGNHDVERKTAQDAYRQRRHLLFAESFPLSEYLRPELEKSPDTRKVATVKYGEFDLEFLLLGSAEAGQEVEDRIKEGEELRKLEEDSANVAAGKKAMSPDEVEQAAIEYARIDPGLVHHADLERADRHQWTKSVRIAVLHHPVSPLPSQEIAKYAGLLNAGRVKDVLFSHQFALVLHGHLHSACLLEERWAGQYDNWILRIAAAASLGSRQIAEKNGFNEIHIQRHLLFEGSEKDPPTAKIRVQQFARSGPYSWSVKAQLGPFLPGQRDESMK